MSRRQPMPEKRKSLSHQPQLDQEKRTKPKEKCRKKRTTTHNNIQMDQPREIKL